MLNALCGTPRRIIEVDLKLPSRPPAFAFVEFDTARAADDAVAGRDGYDFHGERLRVRPSTPRSLPAVSLECICVFQVHAMYSCTVGSSVSPPLYTGRCMQATGPCATVARLGCD